MITDWLQKNALVLVLLALPFGVLPFVWHLIPETIPIHWNLKGEVDGYGPRSTHLLIPLINIGIALMFWVIPIIDPKKNTALFQGTIAKFRVSTIGFLLALWACMTALYLGYPIDMETVVVLGLLTLMLVLGNYMGKVRPGYFIGVRTPWTLENETVWTRTHRLTGRIWVGGAALLLLLRLGLHGPVFMYLFLGYIAIASIIPIGYSYWLYRQH